MFKAVVFDIGQTLVEYNKPLNWSKLYRPALEYMAGKCGYEFTEEQYEYAIKVLTKYNTRVNPRDYEVSSAYIFSELLAAMNVDMKVLEQVKLHFYSYFRREAYVFPEVETVLKELTGRGILLGTLSDVAYGMDNEFALEDIAAIKGYISYPFTSNDVGYRKPRAEGLELLADKMKVDISEIVFVGDEEKDMICAKNAGAYAVLINRDSTIKEFGRDREILSLVELLDIVC